MSSPQLVKELRERTGAGFVDCKKALIECQDNVERAIEFLRQKGIASAAKKSSRTASEGQVYSYIHGLGKIGVLVEVNCETDFVAKTPEFQSFVHDVAMQIAARSPLYLNRESVVESHLSSEKNIFKTQAEEMGKKGPVVDKIVEGKINKFYEEVCLMEQAFIKDGEKKIDTLLKEAIARLGENIVIRRFSRFQLGEKIEST